MKAPLFAALLILAGLGSAPARAQPQALPVEDVRVGPLLRAAESFDRARYGFTPLPTRGEVWLEVNLEGGGYDVMLHSADRPYRTIAFRRTTDGFRWIGEQQSFLGPREFETADGKFPESITLTYEIENVSGHPLNRLNISYDGPDDRLRASDNLKLKWARQMLREWGY